MRKMKCRWCTWLNYDVFTRTYEQPEHYFCGLHGRARVDINGEQENLDARGSCGYSPKRVAVQLELQF